MRPHYRNLRLRDGRVLHLTQPSDDRRSYFEARATRWIEELPAWKALRRLDQTGDRLAQRAFMLSHEGRPTLHNFILADHGKPKRY